MLPLHARFLLQAVSSLQKQLREQGSDLLVVCGRPEVQIPALISNVAEAVKKVRRSLGLQGYSPRLNNQNGEAQFNLSA